MTFQELLQHFIFLHGLQKNHLVPTSLPTFNNAHNQSLLLIGKVHIIIFSTPVL